MADAIKNRYNYESLRTLALDIKSVFDGFQAEEFLQSTIDETWEKRELKDRIIRISENLGKYLPADFETAIGIVDQIVMNYGTWLDNFAGFFPTFVELYGRDEANWEITMAALARYTQYASSEMAVR